MPELPRGDHARNCRADPVRADCPVDCLAAFLSAKTFVPLRRACLALDGPPRTVRDVMALLEQGRLGEIRGLGPRRIGEIEICLVYAGLVTGQPGRHRHEL